MSAKLKITFNRKEEPVPTINLAAAIQEGGLTIRVDDGAEWVIGTFDANEEGKLVFRTYSAIYDRRIATDDEGHIVVVKD